MFLLSCYRWKCLVLCLFAFVSCRCYTLCVKHVLSLREAALIHPQLKKLKNTRGRKKSDSCSASLLELSRRQLQQPLLHFLSCSHINFCTGLQEAFVNCICRDPLWGLQWGGSVQSSLQVPVLSRLFLIQ